MSIFYHRAEFINPDYSPSAHSLELYQNLSSAIQSDGQSNKRKKRSDAQKADTRTDNVSCPLPNRIIHTTQII